MGNEKLIKSKFPLKGVFEFSSQMSFLSPVVKGDKFYKAVELRTNCWRGSHSGFVLQFKAHEYNVDEVLKYAERIKSGEALSIKARAVLPYTANDCVIVAYMPTEEELNKFAIDPYKRVIEIVKGEDEKECAYTSKRVEYKVADDKGLIAYYPVVCSSRTRAHWETNFLVIRYKDKSPKICYEGIRETCRGNTYKVEGCLP